MAKRDKRKGQVRCLNCFERFAPSEGASQAICPQCRIEWRLVWSSPASVKIRGPVWDKMRT
ncbi:MAG: hypothetical protein SV375_14595 [Thermodesulfobacteriota bacterium]|nr:hypothetical protein [Thermodesulfobacteriota bacterium]